ncbi:MAG: hypothetical protein P0Y66_21555 [Candidatus Kaistia colombiensis]|nr:MAG: hypothetical protein P0Y66_21555 [Kaistia sp.]
MSSYPTHPAAPHILPVFITEPGQPDYFLIGSAIFLIMLLFGLGTLYFRLHALPEHIAHGKAGKLQFELVAVLALLGLFTHNTSFWIAALLLALVPVPDLYAPFAGMASSLAHIAGWRHRRPPPDASPPPSSQHGAVSAEPAIAPEPTPLEPMAPDVAAPSTAMDAAIAAAETEIPPATSTEAGNKDRPGKGHKA